MPNSEYDWELFGRSYKVNGVSGSLYRDKNTLEIWKWRGNIRHALTSSNFMNWLRLNKVTPQPNNSECYFFENTK